MRCEFCGGRAEELVRSKQVAWIGCRDCLRTAKRPVDALPWDGPAFAIPTAAAREVRAYLVAVAAVALAFAVRLVLRPIIGTASPFLLFTPAVMVAAFYGGPGAGTTATVMAALLGNHFFLRSLGEPGIERWDRLALFGTVGALIVALTDVSQRAREHLTASVWREQKARAEAEAANQAKDDFLALISHELQTPASVILGWASLIQNARVPPTSLKRAIDAIARNALVQNKLVQDVLDISRVTSGTLRMDVAITTVEAVVMAAVEQTRSAIDAKGVHLVVDLSRGGETPVRADHVRLQQVFTNLLSNAAKFTPAGGRITVTLQPQDHHVAVAVTDSGVGITPEFLPRVFRAFEQDPVTLSHTVRGLGLGLSIARHFVERHGGTIRAASDGPGRGATFTVSLPICRDPAPGEMSTGRPSSNALRALTVLVVDAREDTRTMIRTILEQYGASVRIAGRTSDGLRAVQAGRVDLVVCNVETGGPDRVGLRARAASAGQREGRGDAGAGNRRFVPARRPRPRARRRLPAVSRVAG